MKYIFRACYFYFIVCVCISCSNDSHNKIQLGERESKGKDLFIKMACNACHSIDGKLKLGPSIKNQFGTEIRHTDGSVMIIDEAYIRESIVEPLKFIVEGYTPIMPSYKPILSDEDIDNIVAYIKSLK